MGLQEFSDLLALREGITKRKADAFSKVFFDLIIEALEKDKFIKIKGFGTFKLVAVGDRESIDVNTGERIQIGGHSKISFIPDNFLRDLINRPFSHFQTVVLNEETSVEELEQVDQMQETDAGSEAQESGVEGEQSGKGQPIAEESRSEEEGAAQEIEVEEAQELPLGSHAEGQVPPPLPPLPPVVPPVSSSSLPDGQEETEESGELPGGEPVAEKAPAPLSEAESAGVQTSDAIFSNKEERTMESSFVRELELEETELAQSGNKSLETIGKQGFIEGERPTDGQETESSRQDWAEERAADAAQRTIETEAEPADEETDAPEGSSPVSETSEPVSEDYSAESEATSDDSCASFIPRARRRRLVVFIVVAFLLMLASYFVGYYHLLCPGCGSSSSAVPVSVQPSRSVPAAKPSNPAPSPVVSDTSAGQADTLVPVRPVSTPQPGTGSQAVGHPSAPAEQGREAAARSSKAAERETTTAKRSDEPKKRKSHKKTGRDPYIITGTMANYTVRRGETLRTIALRVYGSKSFASYIIRHNNLANPDQIAEGTVVRLPQLELAPGDTTTRSE